MSRPDTHAAEKRDLHARITAAIDQAEALARKASDHVHSPGLWISLGGEVRDVTDGRDWPVAVMHRRTVGETADHIALWDPDAVLRGLAEDRAILRRHAPVNEAPYRTPKCRHDSSNGVTYVVPWPCPEWVSVARRHGIEAS